MSIVRLSVCECDVGDLSFVITRPVESHSGARENIIAGPYPSPILYVLISRRRRGANVGRGIPSPSDYRVRGSVVSSPSRVRKWNFMHILGQKEAIWSTTFSIFERRRGPPNVAGPGKTFPPPPPLSTGLHGDHISWRSWKLIACDN